MNETIKEVEALIQELNETHETISHMIFSCEYKITAIILFKTYEDINAKIEKYENILNYLKRK